MSPAALVCVGMTVACLCGCSAPHGVNRAFDLKNDSFAFSNELRWTYEFKDSGEVLTIETEPRPEYSLRCFPMVRAAREFFYHAEFRPDLPRVSREEYRELTRKVVGRNSRRAAAPEDRIMIPGFANLHEFSGEHPDLLKEECGGPIRSFAQRGNWRMIFPLSDSSRRKTARNFVAQLQNGQAPIAHIYRFPDTSLNHALLIYDAEEDAGAITFKAYDPNDPGRAAILTFDRATDTFHFERNRYFAGGPVRAYEVYRGLFY